MISVFQIEWLPDDSFTPVWMSEVILDLYPEDAKEFEKGNKNLLEFIHPEDLEVYKKEHLEFLETRDSENQEPFTHTPFRIITANKKTNYFIEQKKFITNKDGEVRIQSHWVDQTKILNEKRRLELVLEGTGLGFWDWNPQTNEVTFDEAWAEMLGYKLEEIEFKLDTWSSKVHPEDIDDCFADIKKHMEGKTPYYRNIHRMKHKAGHWVYIWDRGKIVEWDSDGNPVRFTGTHTDITKQQRAEQDLIEQVKAKESFLALMSHEIRTPLNSLMGYSELLGEDESLSDESRNYVERITYSSKELLFIVNDILDYSKLVAGNNSLFEEDFDFKDLCGKIVSQISSIKREGCRLELNIEEDVPKYLFADQFKISQVLKNFLSNAVKFCPMGKVQLNISRNESFLNMTVKDEGIGIEASELKKIFEPFTQENDGTTRNYGGTGLGLSICKMLSEALNGDIIVESKKGKGSSFTLTIPIQVGKEVEKEKVENTKDLKDGLKGMTILLVEDNEINQKLISRFLKKFGCHVKVADNGLRAVEIINNENFDIILMDLMMPVMGGIESTQNIKKLKPQMNIIGLSANAFSEDREKAINAGMIDFASKPINQKELFDKLLSYYKSV